MDLILTQGARRATRHDPSPSVLAEPEKTPDGWDADWIDDHRCGDSVGFIDWGQVAAITWRWSE
jgi:hypothetical protein